MRPTGRGGPDEAAEAPAPVARERPPRSALVGRGVPENVTCGVKRFDSAGPMPFTRWRPTIEPNGPFRFRSSTMRREREGPMPGSSSSSATEARSTSIAGGGVAGRESRETDERDEARSVREEGALPRLGPPCFSARRAASTAFICSLSARRASGSVVSMPAGAPTARTAAPRTATTARNRSALRSAGVPMGRKMDRTGGTVSSNRSRADRKASGSGEWEWEWRARSLSARSSGSSSRTLPTTGAPARDAPGDSSARASACGSTRPISSPAPLRPE